MNRVSQTRTHTVMQPTHHCLPTHYYQRTQPPPSTGYEQECLPKRKRERRLAAGDEQEKLWQSCAKEGKRGRGRWRWGNAPPTNDTLVPVYTCVCQLVCQLALAIVHYTLTQDNKHSITCLSCENNSLPKYQQACLFSIAQTSCENNMDGDYKNLHRPQMTQNTLPKIIHKKKKDQGGQSMLQAKPDPKIHQHDAVRY